MYQFELAPVEPGIFFSIVIPAHNEEDCIGSTVRAILTKFREREVSDFEIVVVEDASTDRTLEILEVLAKESEYVRYVMNDPPNGFGYAVRKGLQSFRGQSVCLVMADLSDSPDDIYRYYRALRAGHECVFGSRFIKGSKVVDYPWVKYIFNRFANTMIKWLFWIDHNDVTNAFKAYRREVIQGILPIISCQFNLTVELPLKAITRGYRYIKIPISWHNRQAGDSKLVLQEMGSRYLFIALYVWLEWRLAGSDYVRRLPALSDVQVDEDERLRPPVSTSPEVTTRH